MLKFASAELGPLFGEADCTKVFSIALSFDSPHFIVDSSKFKKVPSAKTPRTFLPKQLYMRRTSSD